MRLRTHLSLSGLIGDRKSPKGRFNTLNFFPSRSNILLYFLPWGRSEGKCDMDAEEKRAVLGSAEDENDAERAGGGCVRFFDNFRRGVGAGSPSPLTSAGLELDFSGDIFSGEDTSCADDP